MNKNHGLLSLLVVSLRMENNPPVTETGKKRVRSRVCWVCNLRVMKFEGFVVAGGLFWIAHFGKWPVFFLAGAHWATKTCKCKGASDFFPLGILSSVQVTKYGEEPKMIGQRQHGINISSKCHQVGKLYHFISAPWK